MTFRTDAQRKAAMAKMHAQQSVMRGVVPRKATFWAARNPLAQGSSGGGKVRRLGNPQRGPQTLEQGIVLRALREAGMKGSSLLKRAGFTTGFSSVKQTATARRQERSTTRQMLRDFALAGGVSAVAALPVGYLALRTKAGQRAALWAARRFRPMKMIGGLSRTAGDLANRSAEIAVRRRIYGAGQAVGRYVDKGFAKLFGSEVVPAQVLRQMNEPAAARSFWPGVESMVVKKGSPKAGQMHVKGTKYRGIIRGLEDVVGQKAMREAAARHTVGEGANLTRQRRLLLSMDANPIGLVDRFDMRMRRWLFSKLAPTPTGASSRMRMLQRLRIPVSTGEALEHSGRLQMVADAKLKQNLWKQVLHGGKNIENRTYTQVKGAIRRRTPFGALPKPPASLGNPLARPYAPKKVKVSTNYIKVAQDIRAARPPKALSLPTGWEGMRHKPYIDRLTWLIKRHPRGTPMKDLERMAREMGKAQ